MAYSKQIWVRGEKVASTKLNHMEDGIDAISANGAIDTANLANAAVTNDKIDQEAVDSNNIRTGAIITQAIYDGAVTTPKLSDGSVTTAKIANYAVTDAKLADDAVTTSKLADESVTLDKLAVDTVAELDNKADIDGSYESMTVGNAEQLVSSVGITDQTPYNFRTSGGSTEIGDREELRAVVGGTVTWNQYLQKANFSVTGGTASTDEDGVCTFTASASGQQAYRNALFPANRVFLASITFKTTTASSNIKMRCFAQDIEGTETTSWQTLYTIAKLENAGTQTVGVIDRRESGWDAITINPPMFIDLTAMFGSTIADYIYALEQSNAGAGVAYFRKLFPKPYYAYNSGELLSVQTSAHKTIGFNQWDEEWVNGRWAGNNGVFNPAFTSYVASKNKIPVLPNTTYYFTIDNSVMSGREIVYYDADENWISDAPSSYVNQAFTTPLNCHYVTFNLGRAYGATYNHDICINISWDGERDGEYEPYEAHTYALDDVELRGILKLDANNNLYYDGDRYLPDGTVERRFAERAYQSGDESLADAITDGTTTVYKLATPNTETADPYQQTQIVDDFGTEEFIDAAVEANERDVAIPVGNVTFYPQNLRKKIEGLPFDFSTLIARTEKAFKATKAYAVNEFLTINNQLYKVRTSIANGATITVGTNVTATTIGAELTAILNS